MAPVRILESEEHAHFAKAFPEEVRAIRYGAQPEEWERGVDKIWAFGLRPEGSLSYYIGLDWLDRDQGLALRVSPKIPGLDYLSMFETCLESRVAGRYLGQAYDVRTETRFIECEDDRHDFTPLLVRHYLALLDQLVVKPLKKGYLPRTENLSSRIKGKVMLSSHLKVNVLGLRPTRIMCCFQDFSTDCPENRLLHSAYRIGLDHLRRWARPEFRSGTRKYDAISPAFHGVGLLECPQDLHGIRTNPLYPEYREALRLARIIYLIQGYRDRHHDGKKRHIPPYVIDMSKLFELYVYHLLHSAMGERFTYQSKGKYGYTDFLDLKEQMVIDAKYKLAYETRYKIEDIRQVSAYARDLGVMGHLKLPDLNQIVPCLIIYPDQNLAVPMSFDDTYESGRAPIEAFHQVHKLAIRLPMLSDVPDPD